MSYLKELNTESCDQFVKAIYNDKVDYFASAVSRWINLEYHLGYHAWSNSGVLETV